MGYRVTSLVLLCATFLTGGNTAVYRAPSDENVPVDSSQQIADRIVASKVPVLIDFWAPWCAPCRMLNPIIKELEHEYKGKVLFLKVNIDIHRGLADYFRVQGIPAVFILKDRAVVSAMVGFRTKKDYQAAIEAQLKKSAPVPAPEAPAPEK
ncbi:MAG: thioredoxin [Chitinispirillaceae bacterium]|jgi:thioredoxin 1|nr:thioredoxin [Chitinispirillaceae bacterium]